ncbi:MAG: hypothetical protein V7703_08230 [Hyphomicrobiales bacterium]
MNDIGEALLEQVLVRRYQVNLLKTDLPVLGFVDRAFKIQKIIGRTGTVRFNAAMEKALAIFAFSM